ncbi:hypothetical protein V502_06497 [Pseudogymnoascus sp. VKM F-4520 (FW-2644)]|nr:hypothetical protein V502_06497 [Pseudogymnoascus sp. VKM F-4520 (FW-2644)]
MRIPIPANRDVQPVAQRPHDRAVDEVEGVRDAPEVQVKAHLEEALQPRHMRHRRHHRHGREEEIEPLVVEDGLRLEEGEVVPPARLAEDADVGAVGRHAPEVQADDEEVEEDEFLPRLEEGEEVRELVFGGEQVEVAEHHAREEHGEEGAVDNVHAVVDHAQLAPQARVLAAPRERQEGRVDDNRALEFHGDRPHMAVVVEKRVPAAIKYKSKILEIAVPLQQLIPVAALVLRIRPDAQRVPGRHEQERRHDDGDVQAHPAPKQRRREVIPQLAILPGLDQRQRLRRQHVPRNDEEDGDGEVAAAEEGADEGQTRKIVLVVVAKRVLEDLVGPQGVARPQVVVLPVHEEGRETSQPVEIRRAAQLRLGLAAAGARQEGRAQVFGPVLGDARERGELGVGVGGDPFLAQEAVVLEGHFGRWYGRGMQGRSGSAKKWRMESDGDEAGLVSGLRREGAIVR